MVFAYLFIFTIILAEAVDLLNVNFMTAGYWEERLIIVIYLASSVLAGLALIKIGQLLRGKNLSRLYITFMIGTIVILGFTSTTLTPEYFHYELADKALVGEEKDAVINLSSIVKDDTRAPVWTVTDRSLIEAQYSSSSRVVREQRGQLWSSQYPEMALNLLPVEEDMSSPYFYLNERDLGVLNSAYSEGYLVKYLLSSFQTAYQNTQTAVLAVPEISAPKLSSDTVLLIPDGDNEDYLYIYNVLSLGEREYTTYLESDSNIDGDTFILPVDKLYNLDNLEGKDVLIINTSGYGPYARQIFESKLKLNLSFENDIEDAFFHLTGDYDPQFESIRTSFPLTGNQFEFIVDNDAAENLPAVISADNQTSFWTAFATGEGNIGAPTMTDSQDSKAEGSDSLRIGVGEGNNLVWVLKHDYEEAQDWSSYDFISFYWYGYGDDKGYDLDIHTTSGRFYYSFYDSWEGWKKVIIPLRMDAGVRNVAGVKIKKALLSEPSWDNSVCSVRITLSTGNFNRAGTWYLDRVILDTGKWAELGIEVEGASAENTIFDISIYNGDSYEPLLTIADGDTSNNVNNEQVYFLNGSKASALYGDSSESTARLDYESGIYTLVFRFKLPPDIGDDYTSGSISQVKLKLTLPDTELQSASIKSSADCLDLPGAVDTPYFELKDGYTTLAYYMCEGGELIPLALSGSIDNLDVTYINVYPLSQKWPSEPELMLESSEILNQLFGDIGFSLPRDERGDIIGYLSKMIFREAVLKGDVRMSSPSFSFLDLPGTASILVDREDTTEIYTDVISIDIEGADSITAAATNMTLNQGKGFYTCLNSENSIFSLYGDNITLSLNPVNGEHIEHSAESYLEFTVTGSHEVYLRAPQVSLDGEAKFDNAYVYRGLSIHPSSLGQNLIVDGHVEFFIPLSDTYTMAEDFTYSGSVTRDPAIYKRPEQKDFMNSLPWIILLFFIGIIVLSVYHFRRN